MVVENTCLHYLIGRLLQHSPFLRQTNLPELNGVKIIIDTFKMEKKKIFFFSVDSEHLESVVTEVWRKYMQ